MGPILQMASPGLAAPIYALDSVPAQRRASHLDDGDPRLGGLGQGDARMPLRSGFARGLVPTLVVSRLALLRHGTATGGFSDNILS